jgi:ferrous iron transport protein A
VVTNCINQEEDMNLIEAQSGIEYIIEDVVTDDDEMDAFLFSLGCFSGEPITVVSHSRNGCVVSIKDGRYTIDKLLASAIYVE